MIIRSEKQGKKLAARVISILELETTAGVSVNFGSWFVGI